MDSDLDQQLALLRRRIAATAAEVDARMARRPKAAPPVAPLEQWIGGGEVATGLGRHWETEKLFEKWRRHGSMDLGYLEDLPADLLDGITAGEVTAAPPQSWVFLDTETTGLAGGSGTCAFLIGIGRITAEGFRVRQFFMRDFAEEPSMLEALTAALEGARVLVTYNGKAFDIPLLETRYRLARARPPFGRIPHLDLLHGARRLWRLRYESCRLVELENRVLGHEREDDIPGDLIPEVYFEYVRRGRGAQLEAVFRHNALDIVSLACLTGIVPWAFREAGAPALGHAAEMVSLGRWLRQLGRVGEACELFRSGLARGLDDELGWRTLWDLAEIEKKSGRRDAALAHWTELASAPNRFQAAALIELAKHYEHRERNYTLALEFAESAYTIEPDAPLLTRCERLRRLRAAPRPGRLL